MHDPNYNPIFKRTAYVPGYLDIDEDHALLELTRVGFETIEAKRVLSAETVIMLRGQPERRMGRLIGRLAAAPLDGFCLRLAIHLVVAADPQPYDAYLEFVKLGADCNLPLFKKAAEEHDQCVALLRRLGVADGGGDALPKRGNSGRSSPGKDSEAAGVHSPLPKHARHFRANS